MKARLCTLLGLVVCVSCLAQERFKSGDLKGFTKSPTEHIIEKVDEPFVVRSVEGRVTHGHYDDKTPLANVIFEIRGPGDSDKIWGTRTDRRGRFSIKEVPDGKYAFKATLTGFRSVTGTVIVSGDADESSTIEFQMLVGV